MHRPLAIQPDKISEIWFDIKPLIEKSLDWTPKSLPRPFLADIYNKLLDSTFQLWLTYENNEIQIMLITSIEREIGKNYQFCIIQHLAGKNWRNSFPLFEEVKNWAKDNRCIEIIAFTRPTILRFCRSLGFKLIKETIDHQLEIRLELQ